MGEIKDMEKMAVQTKSKINISGVISTDVEERSTTEKFDLLKFKIKVKRLSGKYDELVALVERKLYDPDVIAKDKKVAIEGEIRAYKNIEEVPGENKTLVYIFVKSIVNNENEEAEDINEYSIIGPITEIRQERNTTDGTKVCEFNISVFSKYGNKYYIPCVCWGLNAETVANCDKNTVVECKGRFQSRDYKKKYPDGRVVPKTFYEVAIKSIKKV